MKAKGIRILDKKGKVVDVELPDILNEVKNGDLLNWSILYFYGVGHFGEGKSLLAFEENINNSEKGYFIKWSDLNELSNKLYDIYDIIIIGCKDKNSLLRYEKDQEMYEACDIVIEMCDSSFWEVFSKDHALIDRLAGKFKEIEFLETNFKAKYDKI